MLPSDLPRVALVGTPARFRRADLLVGQGGSWEWLRVQLPDGGEIAIFDPDHLCPPGYFGRPCHLALELFHPALVPNPDRARGLVPQSTSADPDVPPLVSGQVLGHHHHEWRYTGPVTTYEEIDGKRRRAVRHVLDVPQTTLRLVLDIGGGTVLAQLRDPADAPPVGAWTTLRDGRPELVAIEVLSAEC